MTSCVASYKSRCSRFFVNLESRGKNSAPRYVLSRLVYATKWREKYYVTIEEFKKLKDGDDCLLFIADKVNLLDKKRLRDE